jgi:3-oxoadipate enol-lactonase
VPYLDRDGALLYYEDVGTGPPMITTHGMSENGTYWSLPGVTARLALGFRVVSLDMRGHGRSRTVKGPDGFDVETMGDDLDALADHLRIDRFHLLTHATGGMVGVRYAMTRSDRLLSLVLSDATSATVVGDLAGYEPLAAARESRTWEQEWEERRRNPGPFFFRIDANPDAERVWHLARLCFELGDLKINARFLRSFFNDTDPKVDGLRAIRCPTLVLIGEYDKVLMKPSRLMAEEIPGARLVILPGVGHMTALEDPEGTITALEEFYSSVESHPAG